MFCPNCGAGGQKKEAYCRSCGEFLPDFDKIRTRGFSAKTPEENIKSTLFLSSFSSVLSIGMAIVLYVTFIGIEDVPSVIFLAAALFIVIGIWQMINVFTGVKLKNQISKRRTVGDEIEAEEIYINPTKPRELLNEPDFENIVPASVTEKTTTNLAEKIKSSQSKH